MKKLILNVLAMLLLSVPAFAQVEHGVLVGGGVGFATQDKKDLVPPTSELQFDHGVKGNGMVGYRFRFRPEHKSFYDVDIKVGFQGMSTHQYSPFYVGSNGAYESMTKDDKHFNEFVMPISVGASWNYRFTDKFYGGLGVAPTLYVCPEVVFDLPVMAKVGYRASKHFELELSYQYGCLNTLKHFNNGPANGRTGHISDLMLSVYIPF